MCLSQKFLESHTNFLFFDSMSFDQWPQNVFFYLFYFRVLLWIQQRHVVLRSFESKSVENYLFHQRTKNWKVFGGQEKKDHRHTYKMMTGGKWKSLKFSCCVCGDFKCPWITECYYCLFNIFIETSGKFVTIVFDF